jgi:hypothetical protein
VESITSFPYVVCLDFERENAAWTDSLDRAMAYKEFAEFIQQNAEVSRGDGSASLNPNKTS